MQVNSLNNYKIKFRSQNIKEDSGNNSPVIKTAEYNTVSTEASRAYVSPQINTNYKKLETFVVPYIGKGQLYELSNGHKVILIPKAGPTVINTSIRVGNFNEPANLKQMSHLLEHLLDNNCTDSKHESVKKTLEKIGAGYNASTTDFSTNYHINAIISEKKDLEDLICVQAKTIKNSNFTQEEMENEKTIISQELESRGYFTSNFSVSNLYAIQNLFNLKDSDAVISIPTEASIKNIKTEDLINYYNNFYQPKNMVTTIVGHVDDNTIKEVEKYFGDKAFDIKKVDINYPEISTDNLIKKTVRKDLISQDKKTKMAHIDLSFIGPNNNDYENDIKLMALKQVIRNRIAKDVKEDKIDSFILAISQDIASVEGFPTMITFMASTENYNCEKNLKYLYSSIHDIVNNQITEEEITKMKKDLNSFLSRIDESAFSIADSYSERAILHYKLDDSKILEDINKITAEDIQSTAKKYLDLNKASIVVIHPYQTPFDKVKKINEVSFKGNTEVINSKDIHEYILPNNLRVVLDSRPGITKTIVKFNLHAKKNIYVNPEAALALSGFLSAKDLDDNLNSNEVDFEFNGNSQRIYSYVSGKADDTMDIINFAVNGLLKPDLSEKVFEKYKSRMIDSRDADKKNYINDIIIDEIYGNNSIYKYGEGDLKGLEFKDIIELHDNILKNAQGSICITMPQEKLQSTKNEIFKTLMKFPQLKPYDYKAIFDKETSMPLKETKVLIKGDNDSQVEIMQNFKIIESGNIKDRAGLIILDQILGTGDKSLLFKTLREQDKIAYSANSAYFINPNTGKNSRLCLRTMVKANTENLHKVLEEFKNCLDVLINKPMSQEELDKFKVIIKNEIIYRLESSEQKNNLLNLGYNSFYGIDYLDELLKSIDEITPQYIQQLSKHYLTQPYLLSIKGNKEVIEENKEYLSNIGEVINCD